MSPHCLIISSGVLVTYICTIWLCFFFFCTFFVWSWLKRLSALKAVSFLSFFFVVLNTWSNKRVFVPGSAHPQVVMVVVVVVVLGGVGQGGGGFGAEFSPGHCEYKETSVLGGLVCEPHLTSPSQQHLLPCPGIWHCAHKQDSQDKQQAKLFVKPLWCILMKENQQKCHLHGHSKEEVVLMCTPLPHSWAPWEIWSLPQYFQSFKRNTKSIIFH